MKLRLYHIKRNNSIYFLINSYIAMDNVVAESKDVMINELNFDYQRQVNTSQTDGK